MITLTIHNWKHRVTKSGLLISSPADEEDFKERGMEEMNLPGVARSEIRNTIVDYSERYPENFVTHKRAQPQPVKSKANEAR